MFRFGRGNAIERFDYTDDADGGGLSDVLETNKKRRKKDEL
jgi:hypothetical protein